MAHSSASGRPPDHSGGGSPRRVSRQFLALSTSSRHLRLQYCATRVSSFFIFGLLSIRTSARAGVFALFAQQTLTQSRHEKDVCGNEPKQN